MYDRDRQLVRWWGGGTKRGCEGQMRVGYEELFCGGDVVFKG